MKALTGLIMLALLITTGTASAHTTVVLPDGSTPAREARWVQNSLVPTPNTTVTFISLSAPEESDIGEIEASISGLEGDDAHCQAVDPTIYFSPIANRFSFYHELGHLFDCMYMTSLDHIRFRAYMHDKFEG